MNKQTDTADRQPEDKVLADTVGWQRFKTFKKPGLLTYSNSGKQAGKRH